MRRRLRRSIAFVFVCALASFPLRDDGYIRRA
jgi:hypothetical protein